MKKVIITLTLMFLIIFTYAQVMEADIVIDYSEASICGMDEASFSQYETDWYKDKPDINYKMIREILDENEDCFICKKDAPNALLIKVRRITENGGFLCNVKLVGSNKSIIQLGDFSCSRGGKVGTKLNLIKDGAEKIGEEIGKALKRELQKYLKNANR